LDITGQNAFDKFWLGHVFFNVVSSSYSLMWGQKGWSRCNSACRKDANHYYWILVCTANVTSRKTELKHLLENSPASIWGLPPRKARG